MRTLDLGRVQEQAFGYKNNHKNARYVITSNFEKLRFYIDYAGEYLEWNLFTLTKENFASLWVCLAWNSIQYDIPKRLKTESISREEEITKNFYRHYKQFKDDLFDNLIELNPDRDKLTLFQAAQVILNRVVFIRFVEDRGLLLPNFTEKQIIKGWETIYAELGDQYPFFRHIQTYFERLNKGYTYREIEIFGFIGGLFEKDSTLEGLEISDEVLRTHLHALCQYDFNSDVDVNILGHIFEHSLSEIECIKNELTGVQPIAPQDSQRKKEGIFYTPKYITKYIIEQTVGRLCIAKRQELGINDEWLHEMMESNTAETKKKKGQKKIAYGQDDSRLSVLNQYREYLLSLTICDPACGSGAFLNATFDFLKDEHQRLDEMASKIVGNPTTFPEVENEILRNNLYGVDLNEEGVLITCLALWLNTAKKRQKLCSLDRNIKCGNSLVDDVAVASDKAFDWHKKFPQVFVNGGFDVVLGNPPYVDSEMMCKYNPEMREHLTQTYSTAKGNWDLFVPFVERGLSLLNGHGVASFITSNKWLSLDYGKSIRDLVYPRIYSMCDCTMVPVFENASVSTVIFALGKRESNTLQVDCFQGEEVTPRNCIAKDLCNADFYKDKLSSVFSNSTAIIEKISKHQPLGDFEEFKVLAAFTTGEAYEVAKFVNNNLSPAKTFYKLVNTGTIDRYSCKWGFDTFTYLRSKYIAPVISKKDFRANFSRRFEKFNCAKIMTTGIRYFESFLDTNNEWLSTKSTVITTGKIEDLRWLIALYNSRLITFYIRENYFSSSMAGGINFTPTLIKKLPIPPLRTKDKKRLALLSDKMLALHAKLQTERQNFLEMLTDHFDGLTITGKLKYFDELEFTEFRDELKKQTNHSKGIARLFKLPTPKYFDKMAEWKTFFNKNKKKIEVILQKINQTDTDIDRIVYDLYGLDKPEIAIVDSAEPLS